MTDYTERDLEMAREWLRANGPSIDNASLKLAALLARVRHEEREACGDVARDLQDNETIFLRCDKMAWRNACIKVERVIRFPEEPSESPGSTISEDTPR